VLRNGSTTAATFFCSARTNRLKQIAHRLEVLAGYLIAYLNIYDVIRIIRTDDAPTLLIKTFKLTEVQAKAILTAAAHLRTLEEIESQGGHGAARREEGAGGARARKEALGTRSPADRRAEGELRQEYPLARRSHFAEAARALTSRDRGSHCGVASRSRSCSPTGLVRRCAHVEDLSNIVFSRIDNPQALVLRRDDLEVPDVRHHGRFLHVEASKLPGGRGHGAPGAVHRLGQESGHPSRCSRFPGGLNADARREAKVHLPEDEVLGTTRKGKQAQREGAREARAICVVESDLRCGRLL